MTAVTGGGTRPPTLETTVAGQSVQSVLLENGETVPPVGTPVGSLIFEKG